MLETLLAAKQSALRNIAGSCPNNAEFLRVLNDATRMLLRRGDWAGTTVPIYVCVRKGCIVWPRYVGQVRKLNYCHHPLPIEGLWWQFMEQDHYRQWCGPRFPMHQMHHMGSIPVQQDVMGGGNRTIRAYANARFDLGKRVTIFGLDDNGQPLRDRQADGSYTDGTVITIGDPFGSTATFVSRIDRVLKDETTGMVRLYAYDAVNDVLEDIATYEPGETNPQYVRYSLKAPCSCGTTTGLVNDCGQSRGVLALVKLQFIPARVDTDLVLIQNLDALKDMIQAIKYKESNQFDLAKEAEASAIRELNLELRDMTPDDQVPITIEPFHGRAFANQVY